MEENRVYWSWVFKIVNIHIIIHKFIFQYLRNKMMPFLGFWVLGFLFVFFSILLGCNFVDASMLSSVRKLTLTRFVFVEDVLVFSWQLSTNTTKTESLRMLMIPQYRNSGCFVPIGYDRKVPTYKEYQQSTDRWRCKSLRAGPVPLLWPIIEEKGISATTDK